MTDEFGIAGKTLLVTGSGRNLGKAIVLEFAARGANVVINTRSNAEEANQVKEEAEALGAKAIVVLGDAAYKSTVVDLKTKAEEAFGHVDIYVSNAARRLHKDFWETSDDDWHRYLNQQLTASWYLAKAFAPGMRKMTASDVFAPNSGWNTRLPPLFWKVYAQGHEAADEVPSIKEAVLESAANPDRWLLTPAGLQISFDSDEGGCYACNPGPLTVPWSTLKPMLASPDLATCKSPPVARP